MRRGGGGREELAAQIFEVGDGGVHSGDVFIDEGSDLDFHGNSVRDEIFAECWESLEQVTLAPEEAHVRREDFVAGADEIIAVEILDIERAMRRVLNRVEKYLRAGGMGQPGGFFHVHDRAERVGGHGAGDEMGARVEQGLEIVGVERAIITHFPPANLDAAALESEPGGDVGFVVEIGDDDFAAVSQNFGEGEADDADEGCSVHAEGDFGRIACVEEHGDGFAGLLDALIHGLAFGVASAALDVVTDEMVTHGVEGDLGDLGSGAVVEKDEAVCRVQRGERIADPVDGEVGAGHGRCCCSC